MRDREYRRNRRPRRNYFYRSYYYLSDCYTNALSRWRADMPKCFRWVFRICTGISVTALAVNSALELGHAMIPEWWAVIYPYMLGIPAGMATVAKFTRDGCNPPKEEEINGNQYIEK